MGGPEAGGVVVEALRRLLRKRWIISFPPLRGKNQNSFHLGINALRETNVHVCCKCLTVFVSLACLQIQCSSLWPCGFKQTFLNDFCLQKWARWDVLATGRVLLYTYRFLVRSSLDWIVQLTMLSPENIGGPLGHMRSKKVVFFSRFFLTPST